MIWERLKSNRCPECNSFLIADEQYRMRNCPRQGAGCPFRISFSRFDEIVMDLYKPKRLRLIQKGGYVPNEEENQAGLNNL